MKKKVVDEELERFNPDPSFGLQEEEVQSRVAAGLRNIKSNPTNKSYFKILFDNIFTPFNLLMVAVAALLLLVVGPKVVTNLLFLAVIIANILIGTIQECKSKHVIEKLKLLNDDKIKTRRNGEEVEVYSKDIVLDDVLLLYPGDQIPADCIILEEGIVEVNESLLTGESVPVKKNKGDSLFAGSFIVSGVAVAKADKIANNTYLSSIENKAKLTKAPKSHLMVSIRKVIRAMAGIAIPLSLVVFVNELIYGVMHNTENIPFLPDSWGEDNLFSSAVFYGGTTIAYMIPAGMALLASVAMATGVLKLAQTHTLAQNLYSVESLSRVNTLCLDKTGTLTDGTMSLQEYKILDKKYDSSSIETLMGCYLSSFQSANQTSKALLKRFGGFVGEVVEDKIEFSSARKYSAVKFAGRGWFVLGAPEYLTSDKKILDEVSSYAASGLRVVLLSHIKGEIKGETLPRGRHEVAMFIIRDTIRPEVKETMQWFNENDVDIKVISGDNVGTVSHIAKESGIPGWDKAVDLSKLTPEDDFEKIVMENSIFARVSPDQKAEIITILKKNGRITGVTGDGLNDLLAFKVADCSIALANGAAATKNVANLILLDSNFANMKEAVFQGRRVVNNIQRSSIMFVMKDFLWLFITLLPIFLGLPHMVQPTVMSTVNIFITGIASLFISFEPDKTRVKGDFFKNVVKGGIMAGFYMFIPVFLIIAYCVVTQLIMNHTFDPKLMLTVFDGGEITRLGWIPVMAICVSICGLVVFFNKCRPFTKFRKILFFGIMALMFLALYLAPEPFIVSGTEMLKAVGGFANIFPYIIKHIGPNATMVLYRTMDLHQTIFLGVFVLAAYPLYMLTNRFVSKVIDFLLFSRREYSDE